MYITKTDLEARWGVSNIRQWSNLENTTNTANAANIAAAIAWAESEINNRFRGSKFTVPISPATDATLIGWCTAYAGYRLYGARGLRDADIVGGHLRFEFEAAQASIAAALAGESTPDFALSRANQPTAPSIVEDCNIRRTW